MVTSVAKWMLFYAMLLNYCCCGANWGISFESFGFESFLYKIVASKFDAKILYKKVAQVSCLRFLTVCRQHKQHQTDAIYNSRHYLSELSAVRKWSSPFTSASSRELWTTQVHHLVTYYTSQSHNKADQFLSNMKTSVYAPNILYKTQNLISSKQTLSVRCM